MEPACSSSAFVSESRVDMRLLTEKCMVHHLLVFYRSSFWIATRQFCTHTNFCALLAHGCNFSSGKRTPSFNIIFFTYLLNVENTLEWKTIKNIIFSMFIFSYLLIFQILNFYPYLQALSSSSRKTSRTAGHSCWTSRCDC